MVIRRNHIYRKIAFRESIAAKRYISVAQITGMGVGVKGMIFNKFKINYRDLGLGTSKFPASIGRIEKSDPTSVLRKKFGFFGREDYEELRNKSGFFNKVFSKTSGKSPREVDVIWKDPNFIQYIKFDYASEFPGLICKMNINRTGVLDFDMNFDHPLLLTKDVVGDRVLANSISHSDNKPSDPRFIKKFKNCFGFNVPYTTTKISDVDMEGRPKVQTLWHPVVCFNEKDLINLGIIVETTEKYEIYYNENLPKFMRQNCEFLKTGNGVNGLLYVKLSNDPNSNLFPKRLLFTQVHIPSNGTTKLTDFY